MQFKHTQQPRSVLPHAAAARHSHMKTSQLYQLSGRGGRGVLSLYQRSGQPGWLPSSILSQGCAGIGPYYYDNYITIIIYYLKKRPLSCNLPQTLPNPSLGWKQTYLETCIWSEAITILRQFLFCHHSLRVSQIWDFANTFWQSLLRDYVHTHKYKPTTLIS